MTNHISTLAFLALLSGCLIGAPEPTGKVDGGDLDDTDVADTDVPVDTDTDTECEPQTWYADHDEDSYGDTAASTSACDQPAGYVADATDCDDIDAAISPIAEESCNGIDDNCDGFVDETCVVPEIVDQCAAYAPSAEPTVGTYFSSAWSLAVPFAATLGDTVNFGAVTLQSETGVDLTATGLIIFPFIDENGDGVYTSSSENGVAAKDFIGACVLREVNSGAVYAGPVEMDEIDGGRLYFGDDFPVSGITATTVNIECTTRGTVPSGQHYGIAMDVLWHFQSVFVTESGGRSFIDVRRCATNGTQSLFTLEPAVAAYFSG